MPVNTRLSVELLQLCRKSTQVDRLIARDLETESTRGRCGSVSKWRQPDQAASWDEARGCIAQEGIEERSKVAVASDATPHRRIADDECDVLHAVTARVAWREPHFELGAFGVRASGAERLPLQIAAVKFTERTEQAALDQLEPAAHERIPHDVFGARASDASQRRGERGMRCGADVLAAVVEARILEPPRAQLERAALRVDHHLPRRFLGVIVEPGNALGDGRGESPHFVSLVAAFGESQAEPCATVRPRADRALCVRVLERAHDACREALLWRPGKRNFQAKTQCHSQPQQLAEGAAVAEPNSIRSDRHGSAEQTRLVRQYPGQPRAAACDHRLRCAQWSIERDGRGGAASEISFEHQPGALDDARKLRIRRTFLA